MARELFRDGETRQPNVCVDSLLGQVTPPHKQAHRHKDQVQQNAAAHAFGRVPGGTSEGASPKTGGSWEPYRVPIGGTCGEAAKRPWQGVTIRHLTKGSAARVKQNQGVCSAHQQQGISRSMGRRVLNILGYRVCI